MKRTHRLTALDCAAVAATLLVFVPQVATCQIVLQKPPVQIQPIPIIKPLITPVVGACSSAPAPPVTGPPLRGWVDLHTHPVSNLGFGGKLIYGGADASSIVPVGKSTVSFVDYQQGNSGCGYAPGGDPVTAALAAVTGSPAGVLGPDGLAHAGWGAFAQLDPTKPFFPGGINNPCGDIVREQVIHVVQADNGANDPPGNAAGYPSFGDWPKWNDRTHQKMWIDWIRRAWQGGERVMVALAVNTRLLASLVAGPGDPPVDDRWNTYNQVTEIANLVARHPDFMQVARSSSDVYNIVASGKLAVVIGVEVDNIGNLGVVPWPTVLQPNPAAPPPVTVNQLETEIDSLYAAGVRYIFPVHLADNPIGGAAAYIDLFNDANVYQEGHPFDLVCQGTVPLADLVRYRYTGQTPWELALYSALFNFDFTPIGQKAALTTVEAYKLGGISIPPPAPPNCTGGMVNQRGLTSVGQTAIRYMMTKGMLIDIDHMSEATANGALALASQFHYPVNSGHNGLRELGNPQSERGLTRSQYRCIGALHGMAGIGSAGLTADGWLNNYNQTIAFMQTGAGQNFLVAGGFGTDTDGLETGMPPRPGAWAQPATPGPQYQNYENCIGVAACACKTIVSTKVTNGHLVTLQSCSGSCIGGTGVSGTNVTCVSTCPAACGRQFPNAFIFHPAAVQYGSAPGMIPQSILGNGVWDYLKDGVAHYGMLWDYLTDVATLPNSLNLWATCQDVNGQAISGATCNQPGATGAQMINGNLMNGADYFYHTWQLAEQQGRTVTLP